MPLKWWYSAPLVTWAPATIASSEVAAYPFSVNSSSATSTRARLVEAEYCWRRLAPGTGTPGTRGTSLETEDLLIVPAA